MALGSSNWVTEFAIQSIKGSDHRMFLIDYHASMDARNTVFRKMESEGYVFFCSQKVGDDGMREVYFVSKTFMDEAAKISLSDLQEMWQRVEGLADMEERLRHVRVIKRTVNRFPGDWPNL